MTNSLKAFAIYLILVPGIGLMAAPEFLLDLFQFSHGQELWAPRMIGLLAFIIGVLDYAIATHDLVKMGKLTVVLRYFAAAFMVGLWMTGEVEIMILLFAAIDALGATWTMLAIKHRVSNAAQTSTT